MDRVVDSLGTAERNPVNADALPLGINTRTKFGDRGTVDFDAACQDQFLTLSTASQTRSG
jgi:hypothetical protein